MNKLAVIAGVAAVVALSGCKDPDYLKPRHPKAQDEVKQVEPAATVSEGAETETVDVTIVEEETKEPSCTCPAGTVHKEACKCGAKDCKCKVAEPETTLYIVQRGDTLSGISKRYNIKQAAIIELNELTSDKVMIGQRLKLPGKVDVGVQKEPKVAANKAAAKKTTGKSSGFEPYTGATEEYVVKAGDTIGKIAYGHGINIRQLKQLNNLKSNVVKIGQKLKVPAGKVAAKSEAKPEAKTVAKAEAKPLTIAPKQEEAKQDAAAEVENVTPSIEAGAPETIESVEPVVAPVAEATQDYTVVEGDDIAGISIQFGVSAQKVRELNGFGDGDSLTPGQVIKIPLESL